MKNLKKHSIFLFTHTVAYKVFSFTGASVIDQITNRSDRIIYELNQAFLFIALFRIHPDFKLNNYPHEQNRYRTYVDPSLIKRSNILSRDTIKHALITWLAHYARVGLEIVRRVCDIHYTVSLQYLHA